MPRVDFNFTTKGNVFRSNQVSDQNYSVNATSVYEYSTGVARRKPSGKWVPPTNYSLQYRRVDWPRGRTERSNPVIGKKPTIYDGLVGSGTVGTSACFNALNHFDSAMTEPSLLADPYGLGNAALIAARVKLKGMKVDLGTAFGERKQLARMLGDTATNLAKSFRSLRRGNVRGAMDALGISSKKREPRGSNIPKKWLELQYGWLPSVSDAYSVASRLESREAGDWRVTAKALRSREVEGEFSISPVYSSPSSTQACVVKAKAVHSAFVRIDALPANDLLHTLASLGVTNPLLVAWELTPLSFVVDWGWALGDWIESLDAMLGYSTATTSTSLLIRADWEDKGQSLVESSVRYTRNNYVGTKRMVGLKRVVSDGVPIPTLPRLKDPRSLGHMANGLALLTQAFDPSGSRHRLRY